MLPLVAMMTAVNPATGSLPILDPETLARLDEYASNFRGVFRRRDQLARMTAYLRGLLDGDPGKTVEAIATRHHPGSGNGFQQAMQHFITSSPWSADGLMSAYRAGISEILRTQPANLVVLDLAFPKKGQHSVGVQRQLARPLGRKVNCQVAVAIAQVGPAGLFPLAIRLYLPGQWLREPDRALRAAVPSRFRIPATKAEIALQLLDILRAETRHAPTVTADPGYLASPEFVEGLEMRRIPVASDPDRLTIGHDHFRWIEKNLGLDRFEGRTWHGWHHHAGLVLVAYGFLALLRTYPSV